MDESLSATVEVLKEQIKELKEENKDLTKRVSKVEQSREKTEYQFQEIMKALDDLNRITIPKLTKDLEEIKNKPVKRYDAVITTIITAITSAIISFIVSNINK
jgi:predicted nuclease with TOPRIM domain